MRACCWSIWTSLWGCVALLYPFAVYARYKPQGGEPKAPGVLLVLILDGYATGMCSVHYSAGYTTWGSTE